MTGVTLNDRFHGTCVLAILHLRRAARSNDLEEGFSAARSMGMLKSEQEAFVRRCLDIDERHGEPVTEELVKGLQACILSLNTADPA